MTTRREFLKAAGIATVALPLLNNKLLAASSGSKKTGLALYTIRDAMDKNPAEALAAVAKAGFNWVEAASYSNGKFYNMKPSEFRKMVSYNGLKLISSHNNLNAQNEDKTIADAAEAGLKYLILPSLPHELNSSADGYKKAADYFNKVGEKCRKNHIRFGYHNHWIEFTELEGKTPYDILLSETDSSVVVFEMDLAWITAGGKDPLAYFNNYPGRFELLHFKDLSPEKSDATIGEGTIDFAPIYAASKKAGLKYWFIEQDSCHTHTPYESIAISRGNLLKKVL